MLENNPIWLNNDTNWTNTGNDFGWTWAPIHWGWLNVIQLLLAIIGIIGNGIVILVIFHLRRKQHSTDLLIGSLAVADLVTSVLIIPQRRATTIPAVTFAGQLYCRVVVSAVMMWTAIAASIFLLTAISIERLIAVRHPISFQRFFTFRRTNGIITAIWIFSFVLNSYSFYVHFPRDGKCHFAFPTHGFGQFIGVMIFILEYLIPVVTMLLAHVLTIRSLKTQSVSSGLGFRQRKIDLKILAVRRRVTQMLFVVIVTFIFCWTPDQLGHLAVTLGLVSARHLGSALYRGLVVLAFVNSCVNPFIYAARNNNFRRALQEFFKRGSRLGLNSIFGHVDISYVSKTPDRTSESDTASNIRLDLHPPDAIKQ